MTTLEICKNYNPKDKLYHVRDLLKESFNT